MYINYILPIDTYIPINYITLKPVTTFNFPASFSCSVRSNTYASAGAIPVLGHLSRSIDKQQDVAIEGGFCPRRSAFINMYSAMF